MDGKRPSVLSQSLSSHALQVFQAKAMPVVLYIRKSRIREKNLEALRKMRFDIKTVQPVSW